MGQKGFGPSGREARRLWFTHYEFLTAQITNSRTPMVDNYVSLKLTGVIDHPVDLSIISANIQAAKAFCAGPEGEGYHKDFLLHEVRDLEILVDKIKRTQERGAYSPLPPS